LRNSLGRIAGTQEHGAPHHGRNPDSDTSMQDAIAGYFRARDKFLRGMDGLSAYIYAVNVLYVAFVQDIGTTDPNILCEAFQAFRKALIRQHNANQKTED